MRLQKLAEKMGAVGGGIKKNRRWSQFGTGDVLLGMLNSAEEEADRYIYIYIHMLQKLLIRVGVKMRG